MALKQAISSQKYSMFCYIFRKTCAAQWTTLTRARSEKTYNLCSLNQDSVLGKFLENAVQLRPVEDNTCVVEYSKFVNY